MDVEDDGLEVDKDKIYSIGYQGRSWGEFVEILEKNEIHYLIDVRSVPHSRRKEFDKKKLKEGLDEHGIIYTNLKKLGGKGIEDYEGYMETQIWKKGYEKLKTLAREERTAMMCLEKDPRECHRRYIIETLREDGWEVVNIGKGKSWKDTGLDDF